MTPVTGPHQSHLIVVIIAELAVLSLLISLARLLFSIKPVNVLAFASNAGVISISCLVQIDILPVG